MLLACMLAGCAWRSEPAHDDEPTLKSLAGRQVEVADGAGIPRDEARAIEAYRQFLAIAPNAPQRAQAMRRLGDLEMDRSDNRIADGQAEGGRVEDYQAAVTRYREFLVAYPTDPGNDRVLYQLARAHEQGGELEVALATLDRLVREHPQTTYREEAQFRRGELLFTARDYRKAEQAYASVLQEDSNGAKNDDSTTALRERALYMRGWSQFKQGRLEEALGPFFAVLDRKVADRDGDDIEHLEGLTRADRELVEDSFRVTSLCLANLQGAESIPPFITTDTRRSYEFRVYQQLGEFYLKQERVKDAADTFGQFARRNPLHAQAPRLQARVIGIYEQTGFANLALDAKKDYVSRYGADSDFRQANPAGWERAQPLVKTHLAALARHYHASAQKSRSNADYQEAVRWYRAGLASFRDDDDAAQNRFLLAELLFEDSRFAEATVEYEKTAYDYPPHTRSADAGYAALLSYAAQEKRASAADQTLLQQSEVTSALRYGQTFPTDPRAGAVLAHAAEQLYALRDTERATGVAQQVLALQPPEAAPQRRSAWTVVAHAAFERGAFDEAERGYGEVLSLVPPNDTARAELVERLAGSVYKQGEQARAAGRTQDAVGHFNRVASVAPQSPVRATAQYDAAAAMIELKDWKGAAGALEDFRQRFPKHALQAEVGNNLALAYLEQGQSAQAAGEFERLASAKTTSGETELARAALWQAAELYEKAGSRTPAGKAYERYLQQYPQPLAPAIEARARLAGIAAKEGNTAASLAWQRQVLQADQSEGAARTDRTRFLGAHAALALAEPAAAEYRKVALVEPLQKQLKLKKARLEDTLKAYAVATDYGVADVTTAATYRIASLYQDFGRALLSSQRPNGLKKAELEQYNVMLEEQAYPFEEKATALHELNARRAADGIYDGWVRSSFKALAELRPLRYGKAERGEETIDAIR
jgi:tetratricopeptide (TPR) repeat protein